MQESIRIVTPHFIESKDVEESDIKTIIKVMILMAEKCRELEESFKVQIAFALAHCQITKENPLRFFVLNPYNQKVIDICESLPPVIINPVIIRHTEVTVTKPEGCLSFVGFGGANVERHNKITVEFQELHEKDGDFFISEKKTKNMGGKLAQIFQHEIDHFDAKYIFEEDIVDGIAKAIEKGEKEQKDKNKEDDKKHGGKATI